MKAVKNVKIYSCWVLLVRDLSRVQSLKINGGRDSVACAKFRLESVYAFEEAKMDIYRIFFQKM